MDRNDKYVIMWYPVAFMERFRNLLYNGNSYGRKDIHVFRKNKAKPEKNEDFIVADTQDLHEEMIESLIAICEDGISYEDAFVLSDEDIYVYADILSIHDNVVQILFQLHHDWLEDTIFEAIAASGSSVHDAILNACKQYYDQVLSLYRKAIRNDEKQYTCEGFTQERHFFDVFASKLGGIGKKKDRM